MSLNIKNEKTHRRVRELARLTGESMTAAVDKAVQERLERVRGTKGDAFVAEYGPTVQLEPPTHGFNSLAWAIPVVAFILGLGLVIVVIRNWRHPAMPVAASGPAISPELLERGRRQADRDTDD